MDASTPMSGGMDWSREEQVSRYSPIMDGLPLQLPPRMLKTPGMGMKGELTSPQEAGLPRNGDVAGLAEPVTELDVVFAPARPVHQHGCP